MSEKTLTRQIEEAIAKGTTTVEEVHKAIAELPLRILEQSELFRGPAKEVRKVQDRTLHSIYGLVRDVNEKVATYARDLFDRKPGRRAGHAAHN